MRQAAAGKKFGDTEFPLRRRVFLALEAALPLFPGFSDAGRDHRELRLSGDLATLGALTRPGLIAMHRLIAYRNFLREDRPEAMIAALEALPKEQRRELGYELLEVDRAWAPRGGEPGAGFLEASRTFSGEYQSYADYDKLDPTFIRRLLLYHKTVDVTIRTYDPNQHREDEHNYSGLDWELRQLLGMQPLFDADLINVIPYSKALELSAGYAFDGDAFAFAYYPHQDGFEDTQTGKDWYDQDLIDTVQRYDPFAKRPLGIGLLDMNENAVEDFRYYFPINNVNIDLCIAGEAGTELVCTHPAMVDYLALKFRQSAKTLDVTHQWVGTLFNDYLMDVSRIDDQDLARIHAEEEAFAIWRDDLSRALRAVRLAGRDQVLSDAAAQTIVREELRASAAGLRERVRKSSFLSNLTDPSLAFVLSGASSALVDPAPLTAIATGGLTAAMTAAYKILFQGAKRGDRAALKLYTAMMREEPRSR